MLFDRPLVFVDLETTGGNTVRDRITEVGIVEVLPDGTVTEWSSLVNPEQAIPPFIEQLTGISNRMVATAPTFGQLAAELRERLAGRLFIAHNARFDYGFLKNEFHRLDQHFRSTVLCTVKLSRRLYPEHYKHNLDAVIARHGLPVEDRHRALADARAIQLFVQQMMQLQPREHLDDIIRELINEAVLPPHLDQSIVEDLPESPGIYLFYDDEDALLYVGRGTNLRKQVLSHFKAKAAARDVKLAQRVMRIEWVEMLGDLGALLAESKAVRAAPPRLNHRQRKSTELCSYQLQQQADGGLGPVLVYGKELDFSRQDNLYGLFTSPREAGQVMKKLAEAHKLCLFRTGLEQPNRTPGVACSAWALKQCRGTCVGKEAVGMHNARLLSALSRLRVTPWPYAGRIGIRERDELNQHADMHVIDHWCYLGTVRSDADLHALLDQAAPPVFDADTYKVVSKYLREAKHPDIVVLPSR